MSSPKTNAAYGFLAKVETTYGTPVALSAATDGVLLEQAPEPDVATYLYDGQRGKSPAGGPMPRAAMGGQQGQIQAVAVAIGGGAAYSASVVPSLHTLLRACGLEATGAFGGGVEKYTYANEIGPTGLDSLTVEAYVAGQKYSLAGTYGDFAIAVEGPGVPLWTFSLLGIATPLVTDAAIPTITYPAFTNKPPKAETIGLTLGTFTAGKVRRFSFTMNRDHATQRLDINGPGHAGFTPGTRQGVFEIEIERVTLATSTPFHTATTLNPYKLKELGTDIICGLTVGSVQYFRWKLFAGATYGSSAQASIISVQDSFQGPSATWVIQLECHSSTYALQDDFTLLFD